LLDRPVISGHVDQVSSGDTGLRGAGSNERRGRGEGRTALEIVLQLLLSGLAVGCIYGLVALGFVLIYKATELVNFAQGDLLMLGAFTCYMFIVWYGMGYWLAFALAVVMIGLFGALLDWAILRRVIGQPQFAVVMLTIGLGAVFRSFASIAWGSEIYTLPSPFSGRQATLGGLKGVEEYLSIILLCAVLYAFFTFSKLGNAVQAALQNRLAAYSKGIPVKLVFWLILAIAVGVVAIAVSRVPVWRIVPILLIHTSLDFIGLKEFADRLGHVSISEEYLAIIIGTVLLCAVLYAFFTYTKLGIAMQAASQNQLAAYYMGIPVKLVFSLIWAISAGVAAIAGVLLAPVSLIDTNLGFIGLKAFAAAVLGGFGSIPGALAGGLTIGLIELFSGAYLPQGFKDVAAYVVLLIVLAVRPQGMFGAMVRKRV
jgi:branched-subunit amino acid ABC-type transport system permease component